MQGNVNSTAPRPLFDVKAVEQALSVARLEGYKAADAPDDKNRSLERYHWNARVSAGFIVPLHICEVAVRNGVAVALEQIYGPDWPLSQGFLQSLPNPSQGFDPRNHLIDTRKKHLSTGKVIPELKFGFWIGLFTSRFDDRIWNPLFNSVFPNGPKASVGQSREAMYSQLNKVREFRNRVAHYEPIYMRDLLREYQRILRMVSWRCLVTASWLEKIQEVTLLLAKPMP